MMQHISLQIVLICSAFVALAVTQPPVCFNGELGLLPNGHECNGFDLKSCRMFPDHDCFAPTDSGGCCPRSSSGIRFPDTVYIGRLLTKGRHCNAFGPNVCGNLYPNHYCRTGPLDDGVCCPNPPTTGY